MSSNSYGVLLFNWSEVIYWFIIYAMRIEIIGYSGAGKSTLAEILAKHYGIAHLYMDTTQFYGKMNTRTLEEQEKLVNEFLDTHDDWVIDGNYYDVAKRRFELCDEIYFLDYNRFYCLFEAIKRYIRNYNQYRESLGSIESFDFSFLMWILKDGRTKEYKRKHLDHLNSVDKRHHFKSRRELIKYLKEKGIVED